VASWRDEVEGVQARLVPSLYVTGGGYQILGVGAGSEHAEDPGDEPRDQGATGRDHDPAVEAIAQRPVPQASKA
jgi:hypothetical protein